MSGSEIRYRLLEQLSLCRIFGWHLFYLVMSKIPYPVQRKLLRGNCNWRVPRLSLRRLTTLEIEAYLTGAIPGLSPSWNWTQAPDVWRRAPDTSRIWPNSFFTAINYRANNKFGDVRLVWEPARLQQLIALSEIAVNE